MVAPAKVAAPVLVVMLMAFVAPTAKVTAPLKTDVAVVVPRAVEGLHADAGDVERVDLAEEDAARVELVAAELGHQAA